MLNFKSIKITKSFKKLNHPYYVSFEIELFREKRIYRFRLFKTFKNIYNVFYVSLLKFYRKIFEKQASSVIMKKKR